jgi:hypothetical protein
MTGIPLVIEKTREFCRDDGHSFSHSEDKSFVEMTGIPLVIVKTRVL